ncbi:uncharacterized protein GIQ15_02214 [Arthroderma uncinatum]|uniref:uncharacterized protein n=1 Tax=Arthroderma uncinatum TaxID=74035 RepID=UPI00144A72C2|nr:uncharacterized protein GIQ15_02214 [Arthroderma uncinatum]KAF3482890.1 hypothetical protein GIQ15_02214 [Arthroderma uncinatum]
MGNKISAVSGVKSPNFYQPGNAVNEIWVGDLEIISRLPFGDSDMAQAGWPKNDYPKFPWRPFVIPLLAMFTNATDAEATAPGISKRSLAKDIASSFPWWVVIGIVLLFVGLTILRVGMEGIVYLAHLKEQSIVKENLRRSATLLCHVSACGILARFQILVSSLPALEKIPTEQRDAVELVYHPRRTLRHLVIVQLLFTILVDVVFYVHLLQYALYHGRGKNLDEEHGKAEVTGEAVNPHADFLIPLVALLPIFMVIIDLVLINCRLKAGCSP